MSAAIAFAFGALGGGVLGFLIGIILALVITAGPDDFERAPSAFMTDEEKELDAARLRGFTAGLGGESLATAAPPGTFGV